MKCHLPGLMQLTLAAWLEGIHLNDVFTSLFHSVTQQLAISWQHALPRANGVLFSVTLGLMSRIMLCRFLADCALLQCNLLKTDDLSSLHWCPGVARCCSADESLCSVHAERLPPSPGAPSGSHMNLICEWVPWSCSQEVLGCRWPKTYTMSASIIPSNINKKIRCL